MRKDLSMLQHWANKDGRNIISVNRPFSDDAPVAETYRNPFRMFAVAMNMRRLAHVRRASMMASMTNR